VGCLHGVESALWTHHTVNEQTGKSRQAS
jgi:hypothetical protein